MASVGAGRDHREGNDMPGPTTEILNEDVKELRGEIRDIRSDLIVLKADAHRIDMSLTEVRSDLNVLKADVHRIDLGLAEMKAEFRFAKWLIGLLLGMTLTGVGGGVWTMSKIVTKVEGIEARFDRLESSVGKILEQFRSTNPSQIPKPSIPAP
jgi:hypothetical protein